MFPKELWDESPDPEIDPEIDPDADADADVDVDVDVKAGMEVGFKGSWPGCVLVVRFALGFVFIVVFIFSVSDLIAWKVELPRVEAFVILSLVGDMLTCVGVLKD